MSDLLIHSMAEFSDTILACLGAADAREIAEIGAEFGGMSKRLADHLAPIDGHLTSIDPAPAPGFAAWAAATPCVRHVAQPSLDALPDLAGIDAWLVDGDHNYHTVSRELAEIDRIGHRDGTPMLAFLHDVGWPRARRDMYYAPDRIPAEHRHPHSYSAGALLDRDDLAPGRGFRGIGQFAIAEQSGGPCNGVLTAVEDFLADARADGRALAFAYIPAVFGLGVIFAADAPWGDAVAALLLPLHDNALLARVEDNRLRNYLAVLDWQDGHTTHGDPGALNAAARTGAASSLL